MNQKELNEIRRRFKLDKNSISRIYGCYVNSNREIIAYIDESMGLMSQEEQEMYLGLLKKALSGGLGRNLINIEFSTAQVAGSDEHRLLQAVRQSSAQDKDAREALYRRIIETYEGHELEERDGRIYIDGAEAGSYTFGMDYYWMMGDNRHNSADSRFWGFVPEDHIVGKASFVWLSLDANKSFPSNIRWERLFKKVR